MTTSELTLIKARANFRKNETHTFLGEQVVGISSPGASTAIEHGYRLNGSEAEEPLSLSDHAAGKLLEFYQRCRVAAPEDRPYYNCHLLAWYITGKATDLKRYSQYANNGLVTPIDAAVLEAGKTYAIQTVRGNLTHSMVGIDRPTHNVSVLGDCSPLAIMDNNDLLVAYNGVSIVATTPESTS